MIITRCENIGIGKHGRCIGSRVLKDHDVHEIASETATAACGSSKWIYGESFELEAPPKDGVRK